MKTLLVLAFLLTVSNIWAQDTPAVTPEISTSSVSTSATPVSNSASMPKPPALMEATSTPVVSTPGGERFVFQIDGGMVPAISGAAATQLGTGFGFDARISYAFDDFFSMGLETGFYDFGLSNSSLQNFGLPSGSSTNMSHIPVLGLFQIGLGDSGGPIQPYLILAAGFAFDAYNAQGASFAAGVPVSYANFEIDPGFGLTFALDKSMNLFVQAKFDMDFDNNTSGSSGQIADSPIIFIPLQVGLNFNL